MTAAADLAADVDLVLARRHDNDGDHWASADGRIYVGNPFSTIGALGMLHELGVKADHEAVAGALDLLLDAIRDDGRVQVAPKAPMYPCYTAEAARMLCRFGLARRAPVKRVVERLLDDVHETGGWRCNFTKLGKGPGTELANPGATLYVLDALRFVKPLREGDARVDAAVDSLLAHWEVRTPTGPCKHGIGTSFLRVEYPFVRYNLFLYVYVLSFFPRATGDDRFHEARAELEKHLDERGRLVVDAPHRALKGFTSFAKGAPSAPATKRWREITRNVG